MPKSLQKPQRALYVYANKFVLSYSSLSHPLTYTCNHMLYVCARNCHGRKSTHIASRTYFPPNIIDADAPDDADCGPQDLLLRFQYSNTHTHGLQRSCGGKGTARPLPQEGSAPTLALTGFYCFSRSLTSKKVLFYYAKVCFGWLSFADKGEGVAEYIKGGHLQCKGRSGPNG